MPVEIPLYINITSIVLAIFVALVFHEVAHGAVAYLLGDPTAKDEGRLTLNPIKHLDPFGTIMFVILGFGWAKPVPVDHRHFDNPRWGMALVSLAGPGTNFMIAGVLGLFLKFGLLPVYYLAWIAYRVALANVVIGVLNLIPIPPLDGSRLVSAILPPSLLKAYNSLEGYGIIIVFVAIYFLPGGLGIVYGPFVEAFKKFFLYN